MQLSVIIPTFNGRHKISNVLESLKQQTFNDFEIIVVVDGSTDSTIELIEEFKIGMSNLNYFFQHNTGRAGARNEGVKYARTQKLIFLDDDLIFDKNLIGDYSKEINEGYQIIVGVAEPVINDGSREFYDYASYLNVRWSAMDEAKKDVFLNAQNCFIEKECFRKLGGFDVRLRDSEDFDLGISAVKHGFVIHQSPKLIVRHFIQDNFLTYAKRLKEYNYSRQILYELKPDLQTKQKLTGGNFRKYIDSLFCSKTWIRLIDKGIFKILPVRIRFKLYSFFLRAYSIQ